MQIIQYVQQFWLESNNFVDVQIMSVTGHESVSSLAIYHRTLDQTNIQIGILLGDR